MFLDRFFERRSNPQINTADPAHWTNLFGSNQTSTGISVTEENALGVSAIWQAVNLVSGTLSHLPLHLYRIDQDGNKERASNDPLYRVIHDQANDIHTKTDFCKWLGMRLLLEGRAIALIVKNKAGRVAGFVPLERSKMTIEQSVQNGRLKRTYRHQNGITYSHNEVLDFLLHPRADGFSEYNPIEQNRDTIGLMIAAEKFAATLLADGGTPPLVLNMPAGSSPKAQDKGADEISQLLTAIRGRNRKVLPAPMGFDLKPIGIDPAKQQLIELRNFQVSEAARIMNVSPALLHDLSNGSYSNFSQQSQNFGSLTMTPIVKVIESEMNAKLFGGATGRQVGFDMGGLLRGDIHTRMESYSKALGGSGFLTVNEVRRFEDRPPVEGGDKVFVQGASITLENAGQGGFTKTGSGDTQSE